MKYKYCFSLLQVENLWFKLYRWQPQHGLPEPNIMQDMPKWSICQIMSEFGKCRKTRMSRRWAEWDPLSTSSGREGRHCDTLSQCIHLIRHKHVRIWDLNIKWCVKIPWAHSTLHKKINNYQTLQCITENDNNMIGLLIISLL